MKSPAIILIIMLLSFSVKAEDYLIRLISIENLAKEDEIPKTFKELEKFNYTVVNVGEINVNSDKYLSFNCEQRKDIKTPRFSVSKEGVFLIAKIKKVADTLTYEIRVNFSKAMEKTVKNNKSVSKSTSQTYSLNGPIDPINKTWVVITREHFKRLKGKKGEGDKIEVFEGGVTIAVLEKTKKNK